MADTGEQIGTSNTVIMYTGLDTKMNCVLRGGKSAVDE
jgi:hypothetical protein